jgi:hypothetical protein
MDADSGLHSSKFPRWKVGVAWSADDHFWRKAVGRINDLIGSSELVYSKVIRPPIGTLDADQGTQFAL